MRLFRAPDVDKLREKGDVAGLAKALRHRDSEIRRSAAARLSFMAIDGEISASVRDTAAEALIATLRKDSDSRVRSSAAVALWELKDRRAVEALIAALADEDGHVRSVAAQALGDFGDARAVEPLIEVLGEGPSAQLSAAESLGKLGDVRAVTPLAATLEDADLDLYKAAAEALERIGGPEAERALAPPALDVLAERGDIDGLIRALHHIYEETRRDAANALSELKDEKAVRAIIPALMDSEEHVRLAVRQILVNIGVVEPLLDALRDTSSGRSWMVRYGAAWALGRLGDRRAVGPLTELLGDRDWAVRNAAAEALGTLRAAPPVETLLAGLKDGEPRTRAGAARALGQAGDERAVEPLIAALGDSDVDVRMAVAAVLGRLRDVRAVEPLIVVLQKDQSSTGRMTAAQALGDLGDVRAVRGLIAALNDEWDVQRRAAESLERIGGPEAEAALVEYRARGR